MDSHPGPLVSEASGVGHIVLIGLMGSGKTTIGAKLAGRLGRRFVDADDELVARSGRSIPDWFADDGEAAFRRVEAELLHALLAENEPLVVGSGGGVIVTESNRQRLADGDVTVVYLHGTPRFLASRTPASSHRPLLAGTDADEVFAKLYERRDPWYRHVADVIVDIGPDPMRPANLLDSVTEALRDAGAIDIEGERP